MSTASLTALVVVLKAEIETCMKLLGARTVADLGPRFVSLLGSYEWARGEESLTLWQINSRIVERDIYDGDAGLDRQGLWQKPEPTAKAKL